MAAARPHMPVGNKLREFRVARGLKSRQAAIRRASDLHYPFSVYVLGSLERGERLPSNGELQVLAEVVRLEPDRPRNPHQTIVSEGRPVEGPEDMGLRRELDRLNGKVEAITDILSGLVARGTVPT